MALQNLASPVNYNQVGIDFSPLANVGMAYAQKQQRDEQQSQQQKLITQAQDIMKTGDFNAMADFAIANPSLGKTMFELGGIRDEAAQSRMMDMAKGVVTSADPIGFIKSNIEQRKAQGLDTSHSESLLQQSGGNPETLKKISQASWAASDPQGFKAYSGEQPKAAEAMTEYQSEMVRQKEIDQNIRKAELEQKRLDNQLKRETDELKREDLKNKIETNKQSVESAKREKEELAAVAIDASKNLLNSIDQLADNEGYVNSLTGYRGRIPVSATDEGVEAEALFNNITDSLTLDNLKLMSGVLTDKDIELLKSAASGLKQGMGTERFKEVLSTIRDKVDKGLKQKQATMPEKATVDMSDDELLMKYGG